MDFKDASDGNPDDPDCNNGCSAPELAGTCVKKHAGTRGLTTTMPLVPGDQITLIFAIFDMSDPILDSYVFIDNLRWECEAPDGSSTEPPARTQ